MLHTRQDDTNTETRFAIPTDVTPYESMYDSLHAAAWWGAADAVARLLAAGIDCNGRDHYGRTPLHDTASTGHLDIAALPLSHGAEVNARDRSLWMTPLHWAAYGGDADIHRW